MTKFRINRRTAVLGAGAVLATPTVLWAQDPQNTLPSDEALAKDTSGLRRNASSFTLQRWDDHFDNLGIGAILCDITSRAVHYWGPDGFTYRLFPSSVPKSEELTRRGYTKVVRKRVGPTWTPTQNMRERDPTLPEFMEAGPGNPLGTHAMYLTWPAYLIHGTHDTRKIGRLSSSGCIGLYNQHIAELFAMTAIGTQVRLL
ncbi:MAG: L,D-transpeptidase [Rhodobacteraceae bacterium]|nr:L,D-transpeptidase [Paracoccaceae bacterium]